MHHTSYLIGMILMSTLWVLVEGLFAYRDRMFTASQMQVRYPFYRHGLPFFYHGGVWGDLFIVSPLMSIAVYEYSDQWNSIHIGMMFAVSLTLTGLLHISYLKTPFPDSFVWEQEGVTRAGLMHFVYQVVMFCVVGLISFHTPSISLPFFLLIATALTVHVAIGNHVALGCIDRVYRFPWCPEFLQKRDPWIAIIGTMIFFLCVCESLFGNVGRGELISAYVAMTALLSVALIGSHVQYRE